MGNDEKRMKRLSEYRYRTISSIKGPLLSIQGILQPRMGEIVRIYTPLSGEVTVDGRVLEGEVLEIDNGKTLIQVYGDTHGLDIENTSVVFTDSVKNVPLSTSIIGRVFNGSMRPIDGLPMFIHERISPITGNPINPTSRAMPEEFIETGISVIDGLNTLVRGQKLPIFSCAGLPSKEFVAMILRNSRLPDKGGGFVIVFVALGLTFQEYSFYMDVIKAMGTDFVAFINMANEPVMERLLAPRLALTVAEYLAFEKGMDVLVIITDMINYCDALREIATAREELPGRRGYPGYMYSDLASLYERAGRIKGRKGSVTMLPVVTMPEDDITHPIPDLTGYITEGQIVLSRPLHQKGIFPPVDILPSLSRLMQMGIGKGRTRDDHRTIANLLYKNYAKGRDLRRLEAIVGRDGMTDEERKMLDFALSVEVEFINQRERRTIHETLDLGKALINHL
ncbi:MAG: ATP synthase subunit B [Thermodesulfovibrionia bacterium]